MDIGETARALRHGPPMARIDPEQMTGDVVQLGTIATVYHAAATCTVQIGDLVTGELPWAGGRAGNVRLWSPPSVGEQVVVLSPEGDLQNGVILPGIYCDAAPAPASGADLVHLEFADGAQLVYDQAAHKLTARLPGGGTVDIDAPGGVTITGPVTMTGDVTISGDISLTGKLTASDDIVAGSISLQRHKHSAVQPGGGTSGTPV